MKAPTSRIWQPIDDLPLDWQASLRDERIEKYVASWLETQAELREKQLYVEFLDRLRRKWAIETGYIEGLYQISEGDTLTLIEKGLDASLLPGDQSAPSMLAKIRDQKDAIDGLYDFVSGRLPLGKTYIRQLHSVLTAHQPTYEAVDPFGNRVDRALPRGDWKKTNNHVEHEDGSKFEYCPHEHVEAEMDRLLAMHEQHERDGVPPNVESAWLHHRFILIHPFADGNGRVARCLATLVLLKAHWLPLVVSRHDRSDYIDALRSADDGDLRDLVGLFSNLQRNAINEALDLRDEVSRDVTAVSAILSSASETIHRRKHEATLRLRRVKDVAKLLHADVSSRLQQVADDIKASVTDVDAWVTEGEYGTPEADFNRLQIVSAAKRLGYFAHMDFFRSWACLKLKSFQQTNEIFFAFTGLGRDTGVIACAPIIYHKESGDDGQLQIVGLETLSEAPFTFSYNEAHAAVTSSFRRWLELCIVEGLKKWHSTL